MDIVKILDDAASGLPKGEYSTGLNAIIRHVKSAIRHLERDQTTDPDSCTDAIYRMNQAYEGSLKEAYRVLAEKDPSGLSPFEIEGYLEKHNVVRPRVLTQLTRYRQDYRNPSTHNYKLDFDSDEALLAIVSVCGFAKLLINQIKSKIASDEALVRVAEQAAASAVSSRHSIEGIADVCLSYTNESIDVGWFEFERGITDALVGAGYNANLLLSEGDDYSDRPDEDLADVVVEIDGEKVAIDAKIDRFTRSDNDVVNLSAHSKYIDAFEYKGSVVIIRSKGRSGYHLFKAMRNSSTFYVICENDDIQINRCSIDIGEMTKVERSDQ